ncbi:MAG: hypothetical protein RSE52_08030 [Erysipelotrichaceae bacterium]
MKYKKIKLVGIGLASILCIFMINTQNVMAADSDKAYVKITKLGGNFTSWQPKTTCD